MGPTHETMTAREAAGMARKSYNVRTEKQKVAFMNNNCLRTLAALQKAFLEAGHIACATRIKQMEEAFRRELKTGEMK